MSIELLDNRYGWKGTEEVSAYYLTSGDVAWNRYISISACLHNKIIDVLSSLISAALLSEPALQLTKKYP